MYQEKGFKSIFDDVKAKPIINATVKEDEIIKPNKRFSVNNDKFDYSLIVDEYKIPSFKYMDDNSINDFYDFPDVIMSQNPEYRYKYPKLSTEEAMVQYAQTEQGIPNELNRFLRQDQTGESLEDIQKQDSIYQEGLNELQKIINEEEKIRKDTKNEIEYLNGNDISDIERLFKTAELNNTETATEKKIGKVEKLIQTYKKSNPVSIKPAVINQKSLSDIQKKAKSAFATKMATRSQTQAKLQEDISKVTKIQALIRGKNAKKLAEEKRKSVDTSDAKTEIIDTNPKNESYIVNRNAYNAILDKYKGKEGATIDAVDKEDKIKLKGLMTALGVSLYTKKLSSLRNKFKT